MGLLLLMGFNPDFLNNLSVLLAYQTKSVLAIAGARHEVIVQRRRFLVSSPGEQYRYHLRNGGYRP